MEAIAVESQPALQVAWPQPADEWQHAESAEVMIEVRGVGKCYRMYKRPQDRLKQALCRGRRRYFDDFWAVRDVSFELRRGETIGIIGRNGSGKSTLLQAICGTLQPSSGQITRHGRVAALLELGAGFNPEFTGRENVRLNAAIMGLTQEEIERRLDDILAFAEIGPHIDQPVKTYSTGMFMRLAFSVVAHVDADVLVIDEALSVGDALFTQKCMRFLRRFRQRGSLLFVSHDTSAVINLCHRVIWLDRGQVRQSGPAKEVCQSYLASHFQSQHAPHGLVRGGQASHAVRPLELVDQRQKYGSPRSDSNQVRLLEYQESDAASATGEGWITSAQLVNQQGKVLNWVVGTETVVLRIEAQAAREMSRPVIAFLVRDRLGQVLFSDNTSVSHPRPDAPLGAGQSLRVEFTFQMPILKVGDYSISVGLAEATGAGHVHHHWVADAVLFKSITSRVCTGLVGMPMMDISMQRT